MSRLPTKYALNPTVNDYCWTIIHVSGDVCCLRWGIVTGDMDGRGDVVFWLIVDRNSGRKVSVWVILCIGDVIVVV